jgi:aromatic ring-cleaving dioxygenase
MLSGVHEAFIMLLPQLARNRGSLDELGPGTDDGDDLHKKIPVIIGKLLICR